MKSFPQRCAPWSLHGSSTLKDIDQYHHDRDDQENVNESSHRERGDQPNKPEEDQYDRNGPKHFHPLLTGFSAKPSKRSGLFETSSPIREGCSPGLTRIDANVEGVRRIPREESPCQPQQVVVVVRPFCCSHLQDSANWIFGLPAIILAIDRDRSHVSSCFPRSSPNRRKPSRITDYMQYNPALQSSESASVRNASRRLSESRASVCPTAGRGAEGGKVNEHLRLHVRVSLGCQPGVRRVRRDGIRTGCEQNEKGATACAVTPWLFWWAM